MASSMVPTAAAVGRSTPAQASMVAPFTGLSSTPPSPEPLGLYINISSDVTGLSRSLCKSFALSKSLYLRGIWICDELLSDSFPYKEIESGALWEVEGKWVVQGAVDVDIGANPSAEGCEEDEGVDDQAVKVVNIVDTFRLQEQPPFDKKQFVTWVKRYIKNLTAKLEAEKQEEFKKTIEGATKFLLGKIKDLQFFVGESMHDDGSLVFAYYKNGAVDPTFLYFAHGLKEVKC